MEIFGLKTIALFDVWSIEHFASGIVIGNMIYTKKLKSNIPDTWLKRYNLYKILFIIFFWEVLEHYLEEGLLGERVMFWFQGVEFWGNRLITDPMLMLLGYYVVILYPHINIIARIFSFFWLVIHIFIFPHSMYLHEIL